MVYLLHARTHEIIERMRVPRMSLMLLLGSAVVVFARLAGWLGRRPFNVLVICILAFDVVSFSYGYLPFVRGREIFPSIELFDRLKQHDGEPFRIAELGAPYAANSEMVYDLEAAGGYEIPLERLIRFTKGADQNEGDAMMLDGESILKLNDRRVDLLNVRYLLLPAGYPIATAFRERPDRYRLAFSVNNTDVVENKTVLPRAFVVPASGIEVISDEAAQLSRLMDPAFNPERSVILEPSAPAAASVGPPGSERPSVTWINKATNSFQLRTTAPHAGVLVVSQTYYPGWKATVDGTTTPVFPANFALSGIALSAGTHDVRFVFDPPSFKIGAVLTVSSLLILAVLVGWRVRGRIARQHGAG
jgi:hypothetical protein